MDLTNPTSLEAERIRSAAVARALGDPKRLCVLESLAAGEASVGELASRVACQVPNMSQHLLVLRSAGLDLSFVPLEVRARLRFFPERTAPLHLTDRVGTYGSLHFAEVR